MFIKEKHSKGFPVWKVLFCTNCKAERIDYARRLERIEELKAKERQGERNDLTCVENKTDVNRTDSIVADKLGIGGKDTYRKEKYIVDNKSTLSPTDFADWDEGKLSW